MAAVMQSVAYYGARKVRQLALCWRVIASIAHRIGDRTDPDVPAEARRAVDTGSAGPPWSLVRYWALRVDTVYRCTS
jgi:hypothetical protein